MGNFAYHEAAIRGHWDVIDMMLDQEGFECDPINKREGDTPIHCVVRWCNDQGEKAWEYACELIGMMCEAGGDARYVLLVFFGRNFDMVCRFAH